MAKRGFVFCCIAVALLTLALVATAQAPDNNFHLSGYAWSSNIGWVSVDGVTISKSTGNFAGYGWSSNIGWVNFDPAGTPPAAPATPANIAVSNGVIADGTPVTGWIRACSVFASGCTGALKSVDVRGGWDGWIKMSGSPAYAVTKVSTGGQDKLSGFAWGDLVVGWLNFNNVTIGATAVPTGPTVSCDVNPTAVTAPANGKITFPAKWTASGSGGTAPYQYCWGSGCHNSAVTGDVNQDLSASANSVNVCYTTDSTNTSCTLVQVGQRIRGQAQVMDSSGAVSAGSCEASILVKPFSDSNNPPSGAGAIKVDLTIKPNEPNGHFTNGPLSVGSTTPVTLAWETLGSPDSCTSSGGFVGSDDWDGENRNTTAGDFDVDYTAYPVVGPGGHADATYTIECDKGALHTQDSVNLRVTYDASGVGHLVPVDGHQVIRITSQITGQAAHTNPVGQVEAQGGFVDNVKVRDIVKAGNPNQGQSLTAILAGHPAPLCRLWTGTARPPIAQSCSTAVIPHLSAGEVANIEIEIPGGSKLRRVTENSPYKVLVGNGDAAQDTFIIFEYRVPNIQEF